jgi:hypothetical protein
MTRRAATWILVVPLLSSALDACGITKDVLLSDESLGSGGSGMLDAGQGGQFGAGGLFIFPDGSAGGSPRYAAGGSPGLGSTSSFDADPGTGGIDGVVGAGGGPSTGGFPVTEDAGNDYDPHGTERRARISLLCAALAQSPCAAYDLSLGSRTQTMAAFETQCNQALETQYFGKFGDACWEPWYADTACALTARPTCSCTAASCLWDPSSADFGLPCATQKAALQQCLEGHTNSGVVGNCQYWSRPDECNAICGEGDNEISADCMGPPYGAQSCTCLVNGVSLGDAMDLVQQGTYQEFYSPDCQGVATELSNRKCAALLDCCVSYTPPASSGTQSEQCICTADPTRGGYATCAALAASVQGRVVPLCPRNEKPGTFP